MGKKERVLSVVEQTSVTNVALLRVKALEAIFNSLGNSFPVQQYNEQLYKSREARYVAIARGLENSLNIGDVLKNLVEIVIEKGSSNFVKTFANAILSYDSPDYIAKLQTIFEDPKKLQKYLKANAKKAKKISDRNLKEVDRRAELGKLVSEDLVIVGSGPLAVLAAQILGIGRKVTIITEDQNIGYNWIGRGFFYINSSTEANVENFGGQRLPLKKGTSTTPFDAVGLNTVLALSDVDKNFPRLKVACEEGEKKYVAGDALGKVTAVNLGTLADFYLGQRVNVTVPIENKNGKFSQRLVITDVRTGQKRQISANNVLFLTGPGKEVCNIESRFAQVKFEEGLTSVERQCEKKSPNFSLPNILSLSALEKLMISWFEADYKDKEWPFFELFTRKPDGSAPTIAIVGNRDTALVVSEFLAGLGPDTAYPKKAKLVYPKIDLYGSFPPKEQLPNRLRPRYRGVFLGDKDNRIQVIDSRVTGIDIIQDYTYPLGEKSLTRLQLQGQRGFTKAYDYVFVCTGLSKPDISFIPLVKDIEGQTVGRSLGKGAFYGGSAASIEFENLPKDLQQIINTLEINENTIALWVNAILVERLCWNILIKEGVNVDYMKSILSQPQ